MLGLWKSGRSDSGSFDNRLTFNNYIFATKEILKLETLIFFYCSRSERMYTCSLTIEKRSVNELMTATVVAKITQSL